MKRRSVHTGFAVVCAVLTVAVVLQYVGLRTVQRDNDLIAAVPAALDAETADATPMAASAPPRARLARAAALSAGGELEAAEALFTELAQRDDDVGRAASFDLGNAYLRQGLDVEADPARARAIVELAKQRYRDLLVEGPDQWDVRYNLERALRVAPEDADRAERDRIPPIKSVDVVFPGFEAEDLP